jgi:hypothetical protein
MVQDHSFYRSLPSIALLLLGIIFVMLSGPPTTTGQTLAGEHLGKGLSISVWDPHTQCPDVAPLVAIEIDPDRYRFTVHHYQQEGLTEPPDIREWQEQTGHDLVFNAGLFRENYAYLGLLYGNGRSLGSKRHTTWLGLFAAEPAADHSSRRARVLDLTYDSFDEQHVPYREVAQSLMLLDRQSPCAPHRETRTSNPRRRTRRRAPPCPQNHGGGVTLCPWGMSAGCLSLPTPSHGHGWRIFFRRRHQPLTPGSPVQDGRCT